MTLAWVRVQISSIMHLHEISGGRIQPAQTALCPAVAMSGPVVEDQPHNPCRGRCEFSMANENTDANPAGLNGDLTPN
jgi:hypothetical protein